MFDKYITKWMLSTSSCIEVYKDLDEANKRAAEINERIDKTLAVLGLGHEVHIDAFVSRDLNLETYETEYRVLFRSAARDKRHALAK